MATVMELYWKLEAHLRENKPELFEIFNGGNLQVSPDFELGIWADKKHYTKEQFDELVADWNTIKQQNGIN